MICIGAGAGFGPLLAPLSVFACLITSLRVSICCLSISALLACLVKLRVACSGAELRMYAGFGEALVFFGPWTAAVDPPCLYPRSMGICTEATGDCDAAGLAGGGGGFEEKTFRKDFDLLFRSLGGSGFGGNAGSL